MFSVSNYWNVNLWSVKGFRVLTDSPGAYFLNTAWFNKQEIRKLILRNEPTERIFQSEDNHANESEVILFMLLHTDAHVAEQKHSKFQGLYKLLEGRKMLKQHTGERDESETHHKK